ncbi:hypothetical protein PoB_003121800 [Plakobranchus ocellatus]|uniref:DUF4236 domain-containing protein n=1 Tax=Plakobranchus ocellatus TaxID=259542 RepID=A0AAV4AD66_9GAST|nr:hypothetical protein PoB_003121800 [Plakobranchus ocellatus]
MAKFTFQSEISGQGLVCNPTIQGKGYFSTPVSSQGKGYFSTPPSQGKGAFQPVSRQGLFSNPSFKARVTIQLQILRARDSFSTPQFQDKV